jgi:5-oxoprolinase (ATP-hydrolysing)
MRYDRTDCALMCSSEKGDKAGFLEAFRSAYKREFGFVIDDREIIVDDIRLVIKNQGEISE